ncbi:MAG: DUF2267 domain-containing protein [Cyanobacteria bacterium P01_H01_bin.15]
MSKYSESVDSQMSSTAFYKLVDKEGGFGSPYDARDAAEIVFRTLRDLMTTEAADRIKDELPDDGKDSLKSIWQDTNPLVNWLSRVRPPMDIKDKSFLFRIQQEAGLAPDVTSTQAVLAVFKALKQTLSEAGAKEVKTVLSGSVQQLWDQA